MLTVRWSVLFRYCCNAGAHHFKGALDSSVAITSNALLVRMLMVEDAVLIRQAAITAGKEALAELQQHFAERQEWYEAVRVKYAEIVLVGYYQAQQEGLVDAALELLERCKLSTPESHQVEYDVSWVSRP